MKIYPKDIIALVALTACFILMAFGINHVVSGIAIMIITYYFSKRVYEEKHPENDINGKLEKIEEEIKQIPKSSATAKPPIMISSLKQIIPAPKLLPGQQTSGDFNPLPATRLS